METTQKSGMGRFLTLEVLAATSTDQFGSTTVFVANVCANHHHVRHHSHQRYSAGFE